MKEMIRIDWSHGYTRGGGYIKALISSFLTSLVTEMKSGQLRLSIDVNVVICDTPLGFVCNGLSFGHRGNNITATKHVG